jgi:LuxR family maltose regulon positive regulatory protein
VEQELRLARAERELVAGAEQLRARLTVAVPWLSAAVRSELVGCYLTLRDEESARTVLAELDGILEARPRLGKLAVGASELHQALGELVRPEPAARGLTPAEQRLLPLLGTYLSFREIAERLGVSRNTVKTQAISIYRKLGVSSRSEAMTAADLLLPAAV